MKNRVTCEGLGPAGVVTHIPGPWHVAYPRSDGPQWGPSAAQGLPVAYAICATGLTEVAEG